MSTTDSNSALQLMSASDDNDSDEAANKLKPLIIHYTEGLKAMLDVLPEDTDHFGSETVDSYLWVIEKLLSEIYGLLEYNPRMNPDEIFNEFENSHK